MSEITADQRTDDEYDLTKSLSRAGRSLEKAASDFDQAVFLLMSRLNAIDQAFRCLGVDVEQVEGSTLGGAMAREDIVTNQRLNIDATNMMPCDDTPEEGLVYRPAGFVRDVLDRLDEIEKRLGIQAHKSEP
jgi:hypothetical protein